MLLITYLSISDIQGLWAQSRLPGRNPHRITIRINIHRGVGSATRLPLRIVIRIIIGTTLQIVKSVHVLNGIFLLHRSLW